MQHRRFKALSIVSAKKPFNTHLWVETSAGVLWLVDSLDQTKLYKSTDKADNWTLIDTTDNEIRALWLDDGNDKLYYCDCDNANDNNDIDVNYIDLTDDSINSLGTLNEGAGEKLFALDIFLIAATIYLFVIVDGVLGQARVYSVDDPGFTEIDAVASDPPLGISHTAIIGTKAYWVYDFVGNSINILKFDNPNLSNLETQANFQGGTSDNLRGLASDNSDVLYMVLEDTDDNKNYLCSYAITADTFTQLAEYNIALMLDRNNVGTVPNEFEKGFSIDSTETVYEIRPRKGGVRILQNMSAITDAVIIAITDNFLMNNDGDMFEFTEVSSEISTIRYTDGIMGILKKGVFTVHPDFHVNWNKGDSIKIYDDNDILEFHGLITDKNRNARGIYIFKIDSFTNEIYRKTYENAYSGDDSDTKQKDIIDNACDFCYRSSSIVGTTTNYDYEYNRAIIYLFWLTRFLERQVPYIEPDGKIWTKAHDGLVATGKSWDINDNNQEVFLIDIPGLEEKIQGFFSGNSGITRNTIRYKNNASTIRPVAATRDPIEQLQGIIPLNEFRDPKIEAATEANQLGDNRYNIWSSDIIFLGLRIEGQGYLQPGKTIQIQNTGEITISQDDFIILSFERDPKNDIYIRMILSDNIIFPSEFANLQDTSNIQVHTASVQTIENQAAINALLMLGSNNSAWIPGAFDGLSTTTYQMRKVGGSYSNLGATDYALAIKCLLPTSKGDYKLHCDGIKIEVEAADATDYVDRVRLFGVDYDSFDSKLDNGSNRVTPNSYVYPVIDFDASSYTSIELLINIVATTISEIKVADVLFRCYYDT